MVSLCRDCAIKLERGYVCSEACARRANVIEQAMDIQSANIKVKAFSSNIAASAFFLVIGALLVGEKAIFGTPASGAKVLIGIFLLFAGVSIFLNAIARKSNSGT